MSTVRTNNILDAAGGNTATINGMTPTAQSLQGFRNRIINGGMVIDQRNAGASLLVTNTGQFSVDRWAPIVRPTGGGTLTAQQSSAAPSGFSNSLALTVATADASLATSDYYFLWQKIEGFNTADLSFGTAAAQSVTLSFWVRSSLTGQYSAFLQNGAENYSCPISYTINAANTWERKTLTFPAPTAGTWVGSTNGAGLIVGFGLANATNLQGTSGVWASTFLYGSTGDVNWMATSGNTFNITGVQLEAGSVATPFERRDYGRELMMCQRYAIRYAGENAYSLVGPVACTSTTQANLILTLPVEMRARPSLTTSGNLAVINNISSFSLDTQASTRKNCFINCTTTGLTAGSASQILANNDSSASFLLSSEL